MLRKFAFILVMVAFADFYGFAQTPGQMKVVKPKPSYTQCKVIDTLGIDGKEYFVLSQSYAPNSDRFHCQDPDYPDGNFLAYYDKNYAPTKGGAEVAYTFTLKNHIVVGEYMYYSPTGQLLSVDYFVTGIIESTGTYCKGWRCMKTFYNSNGLPIKEIQYYQDSSIYREIRLETNDTLGYRQTSTISALEYDINGTLLYKYNCQNLTRISLNADGSIKRVDPIESCSFQLER